MIAASLPLGTQASQTCVNQPPVSLCIENPPDPFVVDAGSMESNNGTQSAAAQGGLAIGIGQPAQFTASYSFARSPIASGDSYSFWATLEIFGGNSLYLGSSSVSAYATNPSSTSFSQSGVLYVNLTTPDARLDGGSVRLRIFAYFSNQSTSQLIGSAMSVAPVNIVQVTEPRNIATSDVRPLTSIEIASFNLQPTSGAVSVTDAATIIVTGTSLELTATGTVGRVTSGNLFHQAQQDSYVSLQVYSETTGISYYVDAQAYNYWCSDNANGGCMLPNSAASVDLRLQIPGNAASPRQVLSIALSASLNGWAYNFTTGDQVNGGNSIYGTGRDVMYSAGP